MRVKCIVMNAGFRHWEKSSKAIRKIWHHFIFVKSRCLNYETEADD